MFDGPTVNEVIPQPTAREGCNTRSIFEANLTDFNSEFSFS